MKSFIGRVSANGTVEFKGEESEAMQTLVGTPVRVTLMDADAELLSAISERQMLAYPVVAEALHALNAFHNHLTLDEMIEAQGGAKNSDNAGVLYDISEKGYLAETDMLAGYLMKGVQISTLGKLLSRVMCYSTYVQISEILSAVEPEQQEACLHALAPVRVLGMHPRYSMDVAAFLRNKDSESVTPRDEKSFREIGRAHV